MKKLNKTEKKKIFFDILSPYFVTIGFKKYLTGEDPCFVLFKEDIIVKIFFNFFSNETIGCSPLSLTHYEVEDHILNNGIPTNTLTDQKKKEKYHLSTVEYRKLPDSIKVRPLYTAEDLEQFASSYLSFYENEGTAFVNKYSILHNVITEMDLLKSNGLYWKEILAGGPEHLIKGLIISKLCNDQNFDKKLAWLDGYFSSKNDEWTPYWTKYKDIIGKISPKYNLI